MLALSAAGFYWRKHQAPKLTDKDQLILADFTNQTGDAVFDSTLKEALAIQLEQSPLLQLVSDAELHNNLQYLGQPREPENHPGFSATIRPAIRRKGVSRRKHRQFRLIVRDSDQCGDHCGTGEVFAREQVTANDKTRSSASRIERRNGNARPPR